MSRPDPKGGRITRDPTMGNLAFDWAALKAVFHEASELAPDERPAFLAGACDGNASLKREVESLLDQDAAGADFLGVPAVSVITGPSLADADVHRTVGPYRITGLVGRGGMGTVYAASIDLLALNAALERLATFDLRQVRVVELRFFVGFSVEETAEILGVSTATVKREWAMARAWLRRELASAPPPRD